MPRYVVTVLILASVSLSVFALGGCLPGGDSDESGESNGAGVDDAVALGERIYQEQCAGCHANDDSNSVGPSLAGLYGSEVTFEDGSTTVVDGEHIVESVTDPQARIREGYPNVMPAFDGLSEDELAGIVAYIQSLE